VAVIGDTVRTTLFPGDVSPVNQTVHIEGIEFTVIGVQERLGSSFGRDLDNSVYIPVSAFNRMYGPGNGFALFGRPRLGSGLNMDGALDETRVLLRTRFHARPGQPDNFDVLTPDAIRGFIDQVLGMIAAIVVPVTCISLVVGGIVIMNIMLVAVVERTREIGVRMALGARKRDVRRQFLTEAALLSLAGGLMGVVLGALAAVGVRGVLDFPAQVTPAIVLLGIVLAIGVGLAAGYWPARNASNLAVVDALRDE
jgi:putative ABC transport system permease protein